MNSDDHNRSEAVPFPDVIDPFIRACPGPALAIRALHLVASQPVEGITGLETSSNGGSPNGNRNGKTSVHMRSLIEVASALFYTPDHLSREARRYGYSMSTAIRWTTFLQGWALREEGASQARIARCLGFSDGSSWSRFVRNLTEKTPTQLPNLPLRDWVLEARRRVFLDPHRPSIDP